MSGIDIDKVHKTAARDKWEREFAFQLIAAGFPKPETEYKFHPTRKWRIDLCYPGVRLALECQGGIWMKGGGAHSRPANIERDIEKHNALVMAGWTLLLVTPKTIKSGEALKMVETWMHKGVA